jgi:hypothetical protein
VWRDVQFEINWADLTGRAAVTALKRQIQLSADYTDFTGARQRSALGSAVASRAGDRGVAIANFSLPLQAADAFSLSAYEKILHLEQPQPFASQMQA